MVTTTDQAAARTAAPSLLERVRAVSAGLSPAERRVAEAVLRDPMAVIHLSVSQLAQEAETSAATVVRLCANLGLRGYQDLKITLARESVPGTRAMHDAVAEGDDADAVTRKVLGSTADALSRTAASLESAVLARIADRVMGARRVLVGAVGTSAPLAQDLAYRLTTLGIAATFAPDVHTQHVTARMLGSDDLFFAISHTGSTFETLAAARAASAAGAGTVALTSFATSPLTEVVDLSLVAGSAETAYRVEAMASRIVHLAVLDALCVLIALDRPPSRDALQMTEDVLVEHRV
jgi:DNA-binding MurR/RpiR family transcriptional regulator